MLTFFSSSDKQAFYFLSELIMTGGKFESSEQKDRVIQTYSKPDIHPDSLKYLGIRLKDSDLGYVVISYDPPIDPNKTRKPLPVTAAFIIDTLGIRAQYEILAKGGRTVGWVVDPNKCRAIWLRQGESANIIQLPKLPVVNVILTKKIDDETKVSTAFFGDIKDRVHISGRVVYVKATRVRQAYSWLTLIRLKSRKLIAVKKRLSPRGYDVEITGTVKEHTKVRGKNVTLLTNVKLIAVKWGVDRPRRAKTDKRVKLDELEADPSAGDK